MGGLRGHGQWKRLSNNGSTSAGAVANILSFNDIFNADHSHDLSEKRRDAIVSNGCRTLRCGCDPPQMRQLFQNLIGNALKCHRPEHPLVVRVDGDTNPNEPTCRIRVADNGIRFDPKYGDRIFQVFQCLHGHDTVTISLKALVCA